MGGLSGLDVIIAPPATGGGAGAAVPDDNTVTSAKIVDGSIVDADIAPTAAIATTKLSPNPLARVNHTGTQLAATISDFNSAVGALSGGGIAATVLDAGSILKADLDDTPVALAVPASTIVGRSAAGVIAALTATQAKAVLALVSGDISGLGALATKSTIVDADVAAGAALALSKLATDPLARANHTGTQLAATVSDFDAQVRTSRLDQMATPTAPVSVGGQIVTNLGTPAVGTDGANKAYVDTAAGGGMSPSLYDANSILKADADNAPVVLVVGPSTFVGRAATGAIVALTNAQAKAILAIVVADISDFTAGVRSNRLDQMTAPLATVNMNGQSLINLGAASNPTDGITKSYADTVNRTYDAKQSARVAATTNVNLAAPGAAIDGVTMANGQRVLLAGQTDARQNGIYVFNGAAAAMTRSADANNDPYLTSGAHLFIEEGTGAGKLYYLATSGTIVVDTTALTFATVGGSAITPNTGWAVTAGYTVDKAFNPESTTVTEVARALGTLIDALKAQNILGA